MTTQEQREEHKRMAILAGYRKQVEQHNLVAILAIRTKYPELNDAFGKVDRSCSQ